MCKIPRVVTIVAFTCSLIHRNKACFFTKVWMLNAGLLHPGDLIESSNFLESFWHWQLTHGDWYDDRLDSFLIGV